MPRFPSSLQWRRLTRLCWSPLPDCVVSQDFCALLGTIWLLQEPHRKQGTLWGHTSPSCLSTPAAIPPAPHHVWGCCMIPAALLSSTHLPPALLWVPWSPAPWDRLEAEAQLGRTQSTSSVLFFVFLPREFFCSSGTAKLPPVSPYSLPNLMFIHGLAVLV